MIEPYKKKQICLGFFGQLDNQEPNEIRTLRGATVYMIEAIMKLGCICYHKKGR